MKVFLKYEGNEDKSTHKTLKITLPRSWKAGPTSRLLEQFVESYNGKEGQSNALEVSSLHLSVRHTSTGNGRNRASELKELPSDGIVLETISDRDEIFICHGPSRTSGEIYAEQRAQVEEEKEAERHLSKCVRFGCNQRFPKGGPYPECRYHSGPPVFHETAKFWSCCPNKKAYDWEEFQSLPTCHAGMCTDVRNEGGADQKEFLGGCDIREQMSEGVKLRSIDDFNASAAVGGSEGAPVLERLRNVLGEMGVEGELFNQVLEVIKRDVLKTNATSAGDGATVVDEAVQVLGRKMKDAMKSIVVEHMRIS